MRLYIDFDGTIVNTIEAIVSLYNDDFQYYDGFKHVDWTDVNTWSFEECVCATNEEIDSYFNQQRFFDAVNFMDNAKEVLDELKESNEIIIVSMGTNANIKAKEIWIKKNLPYAKFIGVSFNDYTDKSHIDMSDGMIIDDSMSMLNTSNAKVKLCFGDKYAWNEDWNGIRCYNWYEVKKLFGR